MPHFMSRHLFETQGVAETCGPTCQWLSGGRKHLLKLWEGQARDRKSWFKGFDNTTTMFPTEFMLNQPSLLLFRYALVAFCYFKHQPSKISVPDYVDRQRLVRLRLYRSLPDCSMEHFKTQQGAAGHNMGISVGSQVWSVWEAEKSSQTAGNQYHCPRFR